MEYTKLAVVQLLLLGSALGQQQLFNQDGFRQQQRQPQPFQSGFQPSAFPQQQQFPQFQPQRQTTTGTRSQQQPGEQFSTFGEGVETFKQINNRPVDPSAQPSVQTRTQFTARPAVPAATTATFQQPQPLRAAPTPIEFPNALPAPAEQHDAQVFSRRPLAGTPTQSIPAQQRVQPQQAEALRAQQENERLQAETLRIQQENQRIKAENQRIQQENLRFRQESQQSQQLPAQDSQRFQQAQHQIQEQFISQQDELPQQEVVRTAPVVPAAQPTRSRGATRRPIAVLDAAPKPAAVRATPIRVPSAVRADAVNAEEEALFEEQAKNAQYTFASSVDDKLTDNSQLRQETRDGLNLAGLYSYSDGFFRRTVHYEADENGYRVVKEEVEPIGDGPQLNPNGAAEVQAQISGQNFGYRITADDIKERKETEKVPVPQQSRFRQEQQFSR